LGGVRLSSFGSLGDPSRDGVWGGVRGSGVEGRERRGSEEGNSVDMES